MLIVFWLYSYWYCRLFYIVISQMVLCVGLWCVGRLLLCWVSLNRVVKQLIVFVNCVWKQVWVGCVVGIVLYDRMVYILISFGFFCVLCVVLLGILCSSFVVEVVLMMDWLLLIVLFFLVRMVLSSSFLEEQWCSRVDFDMLMVVVMFCRFVLLYLLWENRCIVFVMICVWCWWFIVQLGLDLGMVVMGSFGSGLVGVLSLGVGLLLGFCQVSGDVYRFFWFLSILMMFIWLGRYCEISCRLFYLVVCCIVLLCML